MRRRSPLLTNIAWACSGVVVGGAVVTLFVRGWSADWFEAIGTWVGGVATVLALLWAVRTFRADQEQRFFDIQEREAERRRAADDARQAVVQQVRHVTVALRGGSGYGSGVEMMMDAVHATVTNDSRHPIAVREIRLVHPLQPAANNPQDFRVERSATEDRLVQITPVPGRQEELGGQPLTRFRAEMTFAADSRVWRISNDPDEPPILIS